uniref:Uncharacterized protein n=1 Tax=Romanomermis culicivorax TaxID=13658 RepID=A0A915IEB3_ROMCU
MARKRSAIWDDTGKQRLEWGSSGEPYGTDLALNQNDGTRQIKNKNFKNKCSRETGDDRCNKLAATNTQKIRATYEDTHNEKIR